MSGKSTAQTELEQLGGNHSAYWLLCHLRQAQPASIWFKLYTAQAAAWIGCAENKARQSLKALTAAGLIEREGSQARLKPSGEANLIPLIINAVMAGNHSSLADPLRCVSLRESEFVIQRWINAGFDPSLDIIPAIKTKLDACNKPQGSIRSWRYFEGAIQDHNGRRVSYRSPPARASPNRRHSSDAELGQIIKNTFPNLKR